MLQVRLSPSGIAKALCGILAVLVLCYAATQTLSVVLPLDPQKLPIRVFDVDAEQSLPNYFETMLLLAASVLLALFAVEARAAKRPMPLAWAALSAIFLFMSIDEAICLHESLGRLLRRTWHLTGVFYFAWIIPYGIFALLIGAVYIRFLLRLPRPIAWWFVFSAAVYVGGAMGVEIIDGIVSQAFGDRNVAYLVLAGLEETMESLGAILFIYALLRYAAAVDASVTLSPALPDRRPARETVSMP